MRMDFLKQQKADHLSRGDEIELSQCDDEQTGNWIVAGMDTETGEVTLVGKGSKAGYVSSIHLDGDD